MVCSQCGADSADGYATFLDPLLSRLRSRRIRPYIRRGSALLDIGCGRGGELLFGLSDRLRLGVGIDQRVEDGTAGNIRLQAGRVNTTLPFTAASFDAVSLLAVLEHLENPAAVLREIYRVLLPGGRILITVPTVSAKPVLEFLAFRLGLVSREGVADHKRYYTKSILAADLEQAGFVIERISYFELGFNLFAVAQKQSDARVSIS